MPVPFIIAGLVAAVAATGAITKTSEEARVQGKNEGYEQASCEYEKKLLKQAVEFLNQEEIYIKNSKEKDDLIKAYEEYIDEQEA
jgi:RNA polymerase-interacting CarD/CdnL/TRCF family regulator